MIWYELIWLLFVPSFWGIELVVQEVEELTVLFFTLPPGGREVKQNIKTVEKGARIQEKVNVVQTTQRS